MAYVSNPLDEEELKKQQLGVATSGVVGSSTGGGGGGYGQPAVDTKAPTSSGFVNLASYLGQNQGEGARLAGDSTAELSGKADTFVNETAKNAAKNAQPDFDAGVANSTGNAQKAASGVVAGTQQAADFLGAGYAGPQASAYTTPLKDQRKAVNDQLVTVDDVNAQRANLTSTYGKTGPYSRGFGLLDSFLIGGTEGGRNKIAEVKGKTAGVDSAYGQAESDLTAAEQAANASFGANKQKIGQQTYQGINAAADARAVAEREKARKEAAYGLRQNEEANNAGAAAMGGRYTADTRNRSNYITDNASYGADDVYTDQDIAALNALSGYLGDGYGQVQKGTDKAISVDAAGWEGEFGKSFVKNPGPTLASVAGSGSNNTTFADNSKIAGNAAAATVKGVQDVGKGASNPGKPVSQEAGGQTPAERLADEIKKIKVPKMKSVKTPKIGGG